MRHTAALVALLPVVTACVDTSPSRVELTTAVEHVALTVQQGSLVTSLSGTFDLALAVGNLASGDATIADPPSFHLVTASGQSTLAVLDALPGGATFPVTLKSGEKRTLTFTLTDKNTVAAADLTKVCAGPVQVVCALQDSLSVRATSVESDPLPLAGCP